MIPFYHVQALLCLIAMSLCETQSQTTPSCNIQIQHVRSSYSPKYQHWYILFRYTWLSETVNTSCSNWTLTEESNDGVSSNSSSQLCQENENCTFATSPQHCRDGTPEFTSMKLYLSCEDNCTYTSARFTVAQVSSQTICEKGVDLLGKEVSLANAEYHECGRHTTCRDISDTVGPGCFCEYNYGLDLDTGTCMLASNCPTLQPELSLKLTIPSTIIKGDYTVANWMVLQGSTYYYTLSSSNSSIIKSDTVGSESETAKSYYVYGSVAELIIPKTVTEVAGKYTLKVSTIRKERTSFSIHQEPPQGSVRLTFAINSTDTIQGALQIYNNWTKTWALVSTDNSFNSANTHVACKQLDGTGNNATEISVQINTSVYANLSDASNYNYVMHFTTLECRGDEASLFDCTWQTSSTIPSPNNLVQIFCGKSRHTMAPDMAVTQGIPLDSNVNTLVYIVVGAVLAVSLLLGVLLGVACLLRRRQRKAFDSRRRRTIPMTELQEIIQSPHGYKNKFSFLPEEADEWEMKRSDIEVKAVIGTGNFGTVFKGMINFKSCTRYLETFRMEMAAQGKSAFTVAVKEIKDSSSEDNVAAFMAEIQMMKQVSTGSNAHVVKMVGCITMSVPLALILEYVPAGNLRDYLRIEYKDKIGTNDECQLPVEEECPLPSKDPGASLELKDGEAEHSAKDDSGHVENSDNSCKQMSKQEVGEKLLSFSAQIANGMHYLSSLGIIHRDLACRNVLVDKNDVLKIADFGLARTSEEYVSTMKDQLPIRWMAPETFESGIFSEKSDVWSFGVSLWEIFSLGGMPYKELKNITLIAQIQAGYRLEMPSQSNDEVYGIMTRCWKPDPEDRPGFASLQSMFDELVSALTDSDYLVVRA